MKVLVQVIFNENFLHYFYVYSWGPECGLFFSPRVFFFSVSYLFLKVNVKIICLNFDKIKVLHSRKYFRLLEV